MKFETKYEIVVKHDRPIDVEKLGHLISLVIKPVIENRTWQDAIQQTVTSIISYNILKE